MPLPLSSARAFFRRWVWRRETMAFVPAFLLLGVALGGEGVLVAAAVLFPALFALHGFGADSGEPRDGVTGLPLKGAVIAALDKVFSNAPRSGKTTIAFAVGIDDFADIEATHGLSASEDALRQVGERIAIALRGTDLVGRIDNAIFGAAFGPVARADLEIGLQAAARIQDMVREPILVDGARIHLTCSVGFCLATRATNPSGEAALAAALDALAEAQSSGAGAVRAFSGRRRRDLTRPAGLDSEIVAALENGQIRPWFQPQISTDTGEISGFEALARWEHPTRGILAPKDFLPSLTASGQIERMGEVVLFHAFTALKSWDRAKLDIPTIGVNFSPEELRNPKLANKVAWELDRFDLTADRLTVEILETVVADARDDSVTRTIAHLAEMGCRIDLDDFGTGHASIAALRRFKVGRIKIDRSFITNVDEDREQQKMVAAILGLAEQLGLETLAEGVERVAEHAMLAQLGCGHVQGFGISRPMPFEDTIGWIKRHSEKLGEAPALSRRAV